MAETIEHIEASLHGLAVPIDQVALDPANAREHSKQNLAMIAASLKAFGQQKPIVVDARGICLAGNGTLAAAIKLGWTHVAVVKTSLDGVSATAYAIADNRTGDTSQWDDMSLAKSLAAIQNDESFDHAVTGFDDKQIEQAISRAMKMEETPPVPSEIAVESSWQVLVKCDNEIDQRTVFERLTGEGYQCRVLML